MKIVILSVGNELISGDSVDTNSAWISRQLKENSYSVTSHHTIDDSYQNISSFFKRHLKTAHCIIVTGGLGPTEDDITREALYSAIDVKPQLHRKAWLAIKNLFKQYGVPCRKNNKRQAMLPKEAEVFINSRGTAPGFAIKSKKSWYFLMPGVPYEMEAMFTDQCLPLIKSIIPPERVEFRDVFKVYGMGESELATKLEKYMDRDSDPRIDMTVSSHVISVRLVGSCKEEMGKVADFIRKVTGKALFGEGKISLEEAVVKRLQEKGDSIVFAESCTGGLLTAAMVGVAGASDILHEGVIAYHNDVKIKKLGVKTTTLARYGAVSKHTAAEMAKGVLGRSKSDIAISTTGIAGPDGGTKKKPVGLIYFGLATKKGVITKRKIFRGDRNRVRSLAVNFALKMVLDAM